MLHKGNTGHDNPSLFRGNISPRTQNLNFEVLAAAPRLDFAKFSPGQEQGTSILFVLSSGSLRKPWITLAPYYIYKVIFWINHDQMRYEENI